MQSSYHDAGRGPAKLSIRMAIIDVTMRKRASGFLDAPKKLEQAVTERTLSQSWSGVNGKMHNASCTKPARGSRWRSTMVTFR
jgi:hypothetical protein